MPKLAWAYVQIWARSNLMQVNASPCKSMQIHEVWINSKQKLHRLASTCIKVHRIALICTDLHRLEWICIDPKSIETHRLASTCIEIYRLRRLALNCINLHWFASTSSALTCTDSNRLALNYIDLHLIRALGAKPPLSSCWCIWAAAVYWVGHWKIPKVILTIFSWGRAHHCAWYRKPRWTSVWSFATVDM